MPPERRNTTGRRRRVLYSAQSADTTRPTAASRRAKEKLREARQPAKAYGSKVQRRLRGRWFSLVPVSRASLTIVASCIALTALLLTYGHYAAVTWPSLAYSPEIARPLRLDRPDSFGRWFTCVMLAASSGASLLIYQLRRYRNDDYAGHYRLWRIVIVVLLLASINSLVSGVAWMGSLIDAIVGKRVAFSGYDWLRVFLGVGGIVLAIRMIADLRHSRWALTFIAIACGLLALPEASKWQLFQVESINRWILVTAAPLLGYTALFLAVGGYLRMLYREVRGIADEATLSQRVDSLRKRVFTREGSQDDWQEESLAEENASEETAQPRTRRRWFGLRTAKPDPIESEYDEEEEVSESTSNPPKKKRRFGLRLDPTEDNETDDSDDVEEEPNHDDEASAKPKRRFGLSWRKKKGAEPEAGQDEAVDDANESQYEPEPKQAAAPPAANSDDFIDENEIDWDSLSKSERRRLRKKIKRQGRAA